MIKSRSRKAILICLLIFEVFGSSAFAANLCGGTARTPNEPGLPWPWGREITINLRDLEGFWQVPSGTCQNWFSFQVKGSPGGESVILIQQFDPTTCRVVATGVGYQGDRTITAQMVKPGGSAYNLTVHAFNESDLAAATLRRGGHRQSAPLAEDVVMALSLFPTGRSDDRSAYQIQRIDVASESVCR